MVKPAIWETWVWSLGQEDPLEKEKATHSSTLTWKIPWMEEPGGLQFMELQSRTWLSDFTFTLNEDNGDLLQKVHAHTAALRAPNPETGHPWPTPPPETPKHWQASLGQSLVGSLLLSPGSWCAQGFVCALPKSVSPVLCKFWQLCCGVNGDLLQEGLCHTEVCCTQPYQSVLLPHCYPCGSPLLTRTSIGDTQTVLSQSLLGLWVLVGTRFVWVLWVSVAGMGFDSKDEVLYFP